MLHLSNNIKRLWLLSGLKQEEFAALFGKKKDDIQNYISGKAKPSIIVKEKMAEYFGGSVYDLENNDLSKFDIKVKNPETKQVEFQLHESEQIQENYKLLKEVIEEKNKTIADLQLVVENLRQLLSSHSKI
jgi:transcriptional regulator with XRE-family HTH domain